MVANQSLVTPALQTESNRTGEVIQTFGAKLARFFKTLLIGRQ